MKNLKIQSSNLFLIVFILLILSCSANQEFNIPGPPDSVNLNETLYFEIDLVNRIDDTFKVRMFTNNLSSDNSIFQFPATVPGTYNVMDIGRYVKGFNVYDKQFNKIHTDHISTNQWKISDPEQAYVIEYYISETWDTPVSEHPIYLMAGSSIENDNVLLNTFCVLGYPTGLKNKPFTLKINYPENWTIGTSLEKTDEGYYQAKNFDYLVDSPVLLGEISSETTTVDNTTINVYTYSKTNQITADQIIPDIKKTVSDAKQFLQGLPVDRYSFIFHFEDEGAGALEHSFSSVYVLEEQPFTQGSLDWVTYHEFFHIVTPLNIHSEIIEDFNFVTPTPSQHLWLYEGVTEWASDMMKFRNGTMNLDGLFNEITYKIDVDKNYFDPSYSLVDIGLYSYTTSGNEQFGNIYNRGALVAMLLDIRLLELSNGTFGLRELILELMATYGPENAFSEANFFNSLVDMTYPEIDDFVKNYIEDNQPLPIKDYFQLLGINYDATNNIFTVSNNPTTDQQYLLNRWSVNF